MKQNILFIQFANTMFTRHSSCDKYWECFYETWEHIGYYKGEQVFEIPKWIAEIDYFLHDENTELFYCEHSIDEAVGKINNGNYDFVLMSLMNANQHMIKEVISTCKEQRFLVGGYNDVFMKQMAEELPNVSICDTTKDTARFLDAPYRFGTDYKLFTGERTVPRLTLSYGCLNNCKFCIVPHGKIVCVPDNVINQQLESFGDLDYRLIYIDDKTFGQADNYTMLADLRKRTNRNDFTGFIVQTTTGMLARKADVFNEIGVAVAEIGLETYNDNLLRQYRKPSSEKSINNSVLAARKNNINLIANIIIGLDGETEETYRRTYDFVMPHLENGNFIGINPAIYTDYDNEENLGEIDFLENEQYQLNIKWWNKFNDAATEILAKKWDR